MRPASKSPRVSGVRGRWTERMSDVRQSSSSPHAGLPRRRMPPPGDHPAAQGSGDLPHPPADPPVARDAPGHAPELMVHGRQDVEGGAPAVDPAADGVGVALQPPRQPEGHGGGELGHAVGGVARHVADPDARAAAPGRVYVVVASGGQADELQVGVPRQVLRAQVRLVDDDGLRPLQVIPQFLRRGGVVNRHRSQVVQGRKVQIRPQGGGVQHGDPHFSLLSGPREEKNPRICPKCGMMVIS